MVPFCSANSTDISTQLGRKYTRARRRRFSSQRWRSRAAILCVWQADSTQPGRRYTRARRRRFSSQPVGDGVPTSRQRGSAALQGSLRVGLSMLPVGEDFRPSDGETVPPYFVYGKRIRRSWGGNIPVPVGGDFRPSDGEAVPPYSVYGKRIRRSWGGNIPDGGHIHMAKSLNTVPITLLHTGRCAMRSGVISAERDMVLSMSSSSASMAGTP